MFSCFFFVCLFVGGQMLLFEVGWSRNYFLLCKEKILAPAYYCCYWTSMPKWSNPGFVLKVNLTSSLAFDLILQAKGSWKRQRQLLHKEMSAARLAYSAHEEVGKGCMYVMGRYIKAAPTDYCEPKKEQVQFYSVKDNDLNKIGQQGGWRGVAICHVSFVLVCLLLKTSSRSWWLMATITKCKITLIRHEPIMGLDGPIQVMWVAPSAKWFRASDASASAVAAIVVGPRDRSWTLPTCRPHQYPTRAAAQEHEHTPLARPRQQAAVPYQKNCIRHQCTLLPPEIASAHHTSRPYPWWVM